ncbi:MAG: 50S ribosomal protein L11 methyltransferase, partial [Chloroflexota bacterium]|nr:50S ribosomal protein L11 methyltransferase [Chloroflexota bacterium]
DQPALVRGLRVFDFGAGGGVAAIAAMLRGAAHAVACDLDPLAAEAQRINAELNGVQIESLTRDPTSRWLTPRADVILAGDVCYERQPSRVITRWLVDMAADSRVVLLADPGRAYAPSEGVELLATYEVPTTRELESGDVLTTRVWRVVGTGG